MLWSPFEKYHYIIEDDIAYIISKGDNPHALMPLASKENWAQGIAFLEDLYCEDKDKCKIAYASEDFKNYIEDTFPHRYNCKTNRDFYDYLYSGNDLRKLRGRNFSSKRNHINGFMSEFGDRYEFRSLTEDDFPKCREMLSDWKSDKIEKNDIDHKYLRKQFLATGLNNLLNNYKNLDYKISGIFVDNHLEGFTIGSLLQHNIAQIHVEKANFSIRGIYQVLNQKFLQTEFPKVKYVNREDDAGVEGLRRAKKSYNPLTMIKKFDIHLRTDENEYFNSFK